MSKIISKTPQKCTWLKIDEEDVKALGLNPEKATTVEVLALVRKTLKLPERTRGTGKSKLMKAIAKEMSVEDLEKFAKAKGIKVE